MRQGLTYQNLSISILGDDDSNVIVFLHEKEWDGLYEYALSHHCLFVCITGNDWENDFSPFPHAKVFHGGRDFGGKAEGYLSILLSEILPLVDSIVSLKDRKKILAGYSLAGLFALYASLQTDTFDSIASVSGSLWYPDFLSYLKAQECKARNIYLSIGDHESVTKNQYLSQGLETQKEALDILKCQNRNVIFELNQGGHFDSPEKRILKGIDWILNQE